MPNDALTLAKMAISRISSVDQLTEITVYDANDISESIDKTWIVSGQSPDQKEMITKLPKDKALYVEGGFRVWLREAQVLEKMRLPCILSIVMSKGPAVFELKQHVTLIDHGLWDGCCWQGFESHHCLLSTVICLACPTED